ncbi:hypothetical protein V6N13_139180 [Hibiscus sabdariffa]|uniref:Uncharacterized protein n=1 Tax=Hibiscus sabdariffa TaxID=183260 RepID=A0ABR2PL05_9ROSI
MKLIAEHPNDLLMQTSYTSFLCKRGEAGVRGRGGKGGLVRPPAASSALQCMCAYSLQLELCGLLGRATNSIDPP